MSILSKVLMGKFLMDQVKGFKKNKSAQNATSIAGILSSAALLTNSFKGFKRKGLFSKLGSLATIGSAALGLMGGLKYLNNKTRFGKKNISSPFKRKKKFAII